MGADQIADFEAAVTITALLFLVVLVIDAIRRGVRESKSREGEK
jgi:hypothetical protein